MSRTGRAYGLKSVPDLVTEELPRTRFEGGEAFREHLLGDYHVHAEAADRAAAEGPEAMARLLGDLDKRAAHCDAVVRRNTKIGDGWETHLRRRGPNKEAEARLRQKRGYAALVAAHGRNLRKLRNALCVEMMKALR